MTIDMAPNEMGGKETLQRFKPFLNKETAAVYLKYVDNVLLITKHNTVTLLFLFRTDCLGFSDYMKSLRGKSKQTLTDYSLGTRTVT